MRVSSATEVRDSSFETGDAIGTERERERSMGVRPAWWHDTRKRISPRRRGPSKTTSVDLQVTARDLDEDTAALADIKRDRQVKAAENEAAANSRAEELEATVKAVKKTKDLAGTAHSLELAQLHTYGASAMDAEIASGDDPFTEVKGFIIERIA